MALPHPQIHFAFGLFLTLLLREREREGKKILFQPTGFIKAFSFTSHENMFMNLLLFGLAIRYTIVL